MSLTEVSRKHGVSRGTVVRLVKLARLADGQAYMQPPAIHHPQNLALSA
jgi:hypothetical protein